MRKVIHSVKVAIALVVVSLLYLLDPLYNQVGDNAMWAIMTVVVVFEFFAGKFNILNCNYLFVAHLAYHLLFVVIYDRLILFVQELH